MIGKAISKTVVTIIFITNLIVIALLALSMLAWTVSPEETTKFAYLGLVFPFILILNIIYLFFWIIFFKWKLVFVNVLALVCCWNPISTYIPFNFKTTKVPDDCIKILSYNVMGFNWMVGDNARHNPIFDYLLKNNADIICMQEFMASNQKKSPKGLITEDEIAKILKKYPYKTIQRFGHRTETSFGVACYSKYPITKTIHIPSFSTYNGAVLYELDVKGKKVTLINVHMESNRITAQDKKLYKNFLETKDRQMFDEVTSNIVGRLGIAYKKRAVQVDTIANWLQKERLNTDAAIVCGDFNDTPISYAYHKIKGDMRDAFADTGMGQGITYNENKFWFRIDFIMHTDNLKAYNCTVDRVKYSDHYPIWTYLQFK